MTATIIDYKTKRRAKIRMLRIAAALFIGAIALMAMSCAVRKPVLIPTPVPPAKVTLPQRPVYATASMPTEATVQQRLFWMAQDFGACRASEEQLRVLLAPYVTNPDPVTP